MPAKYPRSPKPLRNNVFPGTDAAASVKFFQKTLCSSDETPAPDQEINNENITSQAPPPAPLIQTHRSRFGRLSPASIANPVHAATPAVTALQGLSTGSTGEAVKALQEALISRGIEVKGGADGRFGPMTLAALNEFQRSVGLEITSSVDEATAIAVGTKVSPLTGLAKGRFGDDVVTLQQQLISAGFTPKGGADGHFGPATEAALKAFQEAEGLAASGVADEVTVAHLLIPSQEASDGVSGDTPVMEPETPSLAPEIAELREWQTVPLALQQKLFNNYSSTLALNFAAVQTEHGPVSQAALKSFQNGRGLEATGVADEATLLALTTTGAPQTEGDDELLLQCPQNSPSWSVSARVHWVIR